MGKKKKDFKEDIRELGEKIKKHFPTLYKDENDGYKIANNFLGCMNSLAREDFNLFDSEYFLFCVFGEFGRMAGELLEQMTDELVDKMDKI